MATFQYHPDILKRYPKLVGGVILAEGLSNGPTANALLEEYQAEQQAVIARIGSKPLSELPSLSAWRAAFRSFGIDPTQYRCAAEALLRRLTKQGNIPSINTLVDLGNLVSIRYGLPVAIFDTHALQGALTVRFSDGTEHFTPLGESEPEHPESGEVIFSDDAKLVVARRWCWRQAHQSAASPETNRAIVTVEAQHDQGRGDIENALRDLEMLLKKYAGGSLTVSILDVQHPALNN